MIKYILLLFLLPLVSAQFLYNNPTLPNINSQPTQTISSSGGITLITGDSAIVVSNGAGPTVSLSFNASASGDGSYNATYATWAYNQSTPVFTYITSNQASWLSTFNQTYHNFAYNQTYSGSTFNSTYATWAYNQTVTTISRHNSSAIFVTGMSGSNAINTLQYFAINGFTTRTATFNASATTAPINFTLKNMYVTRQSGSLNQVNVTVYTGNVVASVLRCTVPIASRQCQNTTAEVFVTKEQRVGLGLIAHNATATGDIMVSFEVITQT
jgi:hypothetical protein